MSKTDFSKAEEAFENALRKIEVQRLWDATPGPGDASALTPDQKKAWIDLLRQELRRLAKLDSNTWQELGISKDEKHYWIKEPEKLLESSIETLKMLQDKIIAFRKSRQQSKSNEDLIKDQMKEHKTKRFNVNKTWLPLD
jgi:hypothetical protein